MSKERILFELGPIRTDKIGQDIASHYAELAAYLMQTLEPRAERAAALRLLRESMYAALNTPQDDGDTFD